jgi:hypothetical protein
MKSETQKFLEQLAGPRADTFENHFSAASNRLALGVSFTRNEWTLLYRAALLAAQCNAAFNGLDERGPGIRAADEGRRGGLELTFMEARDILYASPGWQLLPSSEQELVHRAFLTVFVAADKLPS